MTPPRPPRRSRALGWLALTTGLTVSTDAWSIPQATEGLCDVYADTRLCLSGPVSCDTCHLGAPPAMNPYGEALHGELPHDAEKNPDLFLSALEAALRATEAYDSDGDGVSNIEEIQAGSKPGDAASVPAPPGTCTEEESAVASLPEHGYDTCRTDYAFLLRKVTIDFCGHSPTRADLEAIRGAEDPDRVIDETLKACLGSEYWRGKDGVLWNLANDKIRPIAALKAGDDPGPIPLGDYEDDYALYVYSMIDGHDVREQLTAQFFVKRIDGAQTTYEQTSGSPTIFPLTALQTIPSERRVGLLSTRWFLVFFTMFTPIPRTSAAQAYRSYLGFDIAKMEGLQPVHGEPVDYDLKDVQVDACAVCHATLDPLSYPFTRYNGLGGGPKYDADRMDGFTATEGPQIANTPEAGVLLGEPVTDLVDWGRVAANSDAFAQNVVRDLWVHLVGDAPTPDEAEAFERLWQDLQVRHTYSVEAMLYDLVRTEAYSVP